MVSLSFLIFFCLFLLDWLLTSNCLVQSLLLLPPGIWSFLLLMKRMMLRQNKPLPRLFLLVEEKEKGLLPLWIVPRGLAFLVSLEHSNCSLWIYSVFSFLIFSFCSVQLGVLLLLLLS